MAFCNYCKQELVDGALYCHKCGKAVKEQQSKNETDTATDYFKKAQSYYYGENGLEKNYEEAFKWYQKSADLGNVVAKCCVASCYEYGDGVEQNYEQAFNCYKSLAENGNGTSQFCLGRFYYEGKGVTQDYAKAFEWFLKSASQNDEDAQYYLGLCYDNGEGVKQNHDEAIKWFVKASNNWCLNARRKLKELNLCFYCGKPIKNYDIPCPHCGRKKDF